MSRTLLLLVTAVTLYHATVRGAGDRPQANIEPHYKSEWERRNGDFKPGDWVEYESLVQEGLKVRHTVEEVGDHFLIVMVKSFQGDQTYEFEGKLTFFMPPSTTSTTAEFPETFKLEDKELAIKRVEITYNTGSKKRIWFSPDVPILGIVKTENGLGKVALQMIGYGRGVDQPPAKKPDNPAPTAAPAKPPTPAAPAQAPTPAPEKSASN